ncbi:uncharacterized protein LOC117920932 isoform X2 [Vitis riparia]|uniref:uncharacterized protein LOC117920932 isoform X2 n=1 Tax=Vitis riparia TaxID=96939 RepID=UPI00155AC74A|nr:uncharacterized protein LOC117920932 isoform X2 [Vitis riparia]
MGKPTKPRKPENLGKGKVTPVQVAFIVDRYLSDNSYFQTRSTFRNEASNLISKSSVQEAPKSLLSLGAMLDEYISLKEQKVMLEREKIRLDQEKFRVQTLLQGMQDAMNAYNAGGSTPNSMIPALGTKSTAVVHHLDPNVGPFSGYHAYNSPVVTPLPMPSNAIVEPANFSTPVTNHLSAKKRKDVKAVPDAPPPTKRSRGNDTLSQSIDAVNGPENIKQFSAACSSPHNRLLGGSVVQGSSVAKNLFSQPSLSPVANSSGPKTPPQAISSQNDKAISPLEISSTANSSKNNTPQVITPANCTIISSETVIVSPFKQKAYYVERNQCISSCSPIKTNLKKMSKRDHVKGRLDFDDSDLPTTSGKPIADGISTSESKSEEEIFDMDLPNFDAFGMDFSISELLVDFDLDCEGINYSCQPALGSSIDSGSGTPQELQNGDLGASQGFSELSSTVTKIYSEDMNIQGPDSLTSLKTITKCIRIVSPAKDHRSFSVGQENLSARN